MYIGTSADVQARKNELVELVAGGKQTDAQIRAAELDMVLGIADYIGGGAWTVVDMKTKVRSVALGNMPHAKAFAGEVGVAFNIVEETIGTKEDGTPKVARKSQITGKSETMYLLLGKLAHPWVREGFGLVVDEATKSYGCSNWYSGFTSNLWAPFVASVKKVAGDKANNGALKEKALELLSIIKVLTVDKEEQSGNNIQDMEQRVEDFKSALAGSSFTDVKIDYATLANAPNKSLLLRDCLNDFADRKAKTKAKKAAAVEAEEIKEIRVELGIDAETDIADVITDMKADAQKYNDIAHQFALSVDISSVADDKVEGLITTLETAHKELLRKAEDISNQITILQNRLAQGDQIESVKKSLLAMGIDEQTAKVLAIQSLTNENVQKMLSNGKGGESNGRGSKGNKKSAVSEDADKSA